MKVAITYNSPVPSRYHEMGEQKAVLGVLDEVIGVENALAELGRTCFRVPLEPPLEQAKKRLAGIKADLVFNLFEGFDGAPETEAAIAGYLAELKLPFTGCPTAALALALDKAKTKETLLGAGIRTPGYAVMTPAGPGDFKLTFPCIVKPVGEDASHGLSEESVVSDLAALARQVERVSRLFGGRALVEEFIDGREFNATVLGGRELDVLPIAEIVYTTPPGKPRILTFGSKWEEGDTYFHSTNARCPAEVDDGLRGEIVQTTQTAFRLVVRRGYARIDMRLDGAGRVNVLEVNPNPDISPSAGAARQARAAGMTYPDFIARICSLGLEG